MADISITAANVLAGDSLDLEHGRAGATVAAGEICYREGSTKKLKLADNDSATVEVRSVIGMALNGAADGQPLAFAKSGSQVAVGAVLTAGVDYYLSGTPGKICPRADVTTGDDPIRIGIALSTSILLLDFADPNVTL